MRAFKPDTIIALGGGSPMDAAKVMWLLYEHPDVNFSDLKEKFFDIRKRAFRFPKLGALAQLVCIPTTSGTGAEVTPFAVITDPDTGKKYPLADYALTPTVAIIDPVLTAKMPASTGCRFRVRRADPCDGGLRLRLRQRLHRRDGATGHPADLRQHRRFGERNPGRTGDRLIAREKMHNAGTIAGMAFGNAFLGIVHAMAHTIGAQFHLVHGRTNATLLPSVIRYNGTVPTKLTSWPKYEYYVAPERFQQIAAMLGLPASTPAEGVESYAVAVESLRSKVGIPASFAAQGVDEQDFISRLDELAMGCLPRPVRAGEPPDADAGGYEGPDGGGLLRHLHRGRPEPDGRRYRSCVASENSCAGVALSSDRRCSVAFTLVGERPGRRRSSRVHFAVRPRCASHHPEVGTKASPPVGAPAIPSS